MPATRPDPRNIETAAEFFEALRMLRAPLLERGRNNGDLAACARIPPSTWSGYFRNRHLPHEHTLPAVLKALGVTGEAELAEWERALKRARRGGVKTGPTGSADAPAQLLADQASFTGREREVRCLEEVVAHSQSSFQAVAVCVVSGMAGIGKTALAIRAAHLLAPRFPDGQLFLDLHGFTKSVLPVDPGKALERLLFAIGVPVSQIPSEVEDQAALWRSRLAGKRLLLVLDNAATEAQVRPLLPGSPGCAVLITSRHRLSGLDDISPVPLQMLSTADGLALFQHTSRRELSDGQDHERAKEILDLCGGLPLAIRIAAARLRDRPSWSMSQFADRLRDERRRLAELEVGERSVAAAFQLSYDNLPPDRQRLFRLLGLHPGPDFDASVAAALAGKSVPQIERTLDKLVDDNLLQDEAVRYRFHDLLRTYAAGKADQEEPETDRRRAVRRLLDHYRETASAAVRHFTSYEPEALDRLDAERQSLLEISSLALRHDLLEYACELSEILVRYLDVRACGSDAVVIHTNALEAARRLGDRSIEGYVTIRLAAVRRRSGDHLRTIEDLWRAVQLLQADGNEGGRGYALISLANTMRVLGRYTEAEPHLREALAACRSVGDRPGEVSALRYAGILERSRGHPEAAIAHLALSLELAEARQDRVAQARALDQLGAANRELRQFEQARAHLEPALRMHHENGDRIGECYTVCELGSLERALGRLTEALDLHASAFDSARTADDQGITVAVHREYGITLRLNGQLEKALSIHLAGLELAEQLGQPLELAHACAALGDTWRGLSDVDQAREHWQRALMLLDQVGHPDAEEIRRRE